MVKVKIYVEGGGDRRRLRIKCRQGFSEFFERAGFTGKMPAITACGSRHDAFDDFCTGLRQRKADEFSVLLVDSEAPVDTGVWAHLRSRDEWSKPENATDEQAHLMVQCMETWLVADKDTLAEYFGPEFNMGAIPARDDVEAIDKDEVFRALSAATLQCARKGQYDKGRHSFQILATIDPAVIEKKSPHAARLMEMLRSKLNAG